MSNEHDSSGGTTNIPSDGTFQFTGSTGTVYNGTFGDVTNFDSTNNTFTISNTDWASIFNTMNITSTGTVGITSQTKTAEVKTSKPLYHKVSGIRSLNAEKLDRVQVGDTLIIDFIIFDTRDPVTDLPFSKVAEGIQKYLPKKPVRYRHRDPKNNPYDLLGEVANTGITIEDKIDEKTGQPYKVINSPVHFEAISSGHAELLNEFIEINSSDEELELGSSLGWVETNDIFFPHEFTVTPKPLCKTCTSIPHSGRIIAAAAEDTSSCCGNCKGETMTGSKPTETETPVAPESNSAEDKVIQLHVEKDKLISRVAELEAKIETEKLEADKKLASKEAERVSQVEALEAKVSGLEEKLRLTETQPVRTYIAETLLGLKGDDAVKKAESLATLTAEALNSYKTDLEMVAKVQASSATPQGPIIGDQNPAPPASGSAEEMDWKKWLGEGGVKKYQNEV